MSHDPSGQYPTPPPFAQQTYPTMAGPQPSPPSPKTKAWLALAIAAGVVLVLCTVGAIFGHLAPKAAPVAAASPTATLSTAAAVAPPTTSPAASPAAPPTNSPTPPAKPAQKAAAPATFGDGTWEVGSDIQAGTYKAVVPADSIYCVWQRLKNLSGDLNASIASGIVTPGSHVVVTVKASDAAFETTGCGTWTRTR